MNIVLAPTCWVEELKVDCSISMSLRFVVGTHDEVNNQIARLICISKKQEQIRSMEKKIIGSRVNFAEFPGEGLEEIIIKLGDEKGELRTNFVLEESILECMLKSIRFQYANGNLCSLLEFHLSCVIGRNIHVLSIDKNGDMSLYDKKITGQQLALPKISMEGIEKFVFEVKKDGQEKKKANSVCSIGLYPERKTDVKIHKRWR